jgi:hypothetical protein
VFTSQVRLWILLFFSLFFLWPQKSFASSAPPTLISPTHNSSVTSSKLQWQAPPYSLYTGGIPYRVQVDEVESFDSPYRDSYVTNTSYTPTLSLGNWYWRVKAKDSSGTWSDWSEATLFTLITAPQASPSPSSEPSPSPSSTESNAETSSSTFVISSIPSSLNSNESILVNVAISGLNPNSQYFLKGAFLKEGTSNYFGKTQVNGGWVKNSQTYSSQLPITSNSQGSWNDNLSIMPDTEDSGFSGSGSYNFKVAKYSSSGVLSWSNESSVNINQVSSPPPSESPSPISISPTPSPVLQATTGNTTFARDSQNPSSAKRQLPNLSSNSASEAGVIAESNARIKTQIKTGGFLNMPLIVGGLIIVGSFISLIFLKKRGGFGI